MSAFSLALLVFINAAYCQSQIICLNSSCTSWNPTHQNAKLQIWKDNEIFFTCYYKCINDSTSSIQVSSKTLANGGYQICLKFPTLSKEHEGHWTFKEIGGEAESNPILNQCEAIANNAFKSSSTIVLWLIVPLIAIFV